MKRWLMRLTLTALAATLVGAAAAAWLYHQHVVVDPGEALRPGVLLGDHTGVGVTRAVSCCGSTRWRCAGTRCGPPWG